MLEFCPFVIFLSCFLASIYLTARARNFTIYRYMVYIFGLHTLFGLLWVISTFSYAVNEEVYRRLWPIIFIASLILILETIIFTHGNIKEVLKKVLPETGTMMFFTSMLLLLVVDPTDISLTPGVAIAIAVCGFVSALLIELIYTTTKIYSLMKGGKLFYFWRRLLMLALYYMVYGLVYSISGIFVMVKMIDPLVGNMIVALIYLGKILLMYGIVSYYDKHLRPILEKIKA